LDSPACFAALLGTSENGRWLLTAVDDNADVAVGRRYVGDSFEVQTTYTTPTGVARVSEVMPLNGDRADLIRRVEGISGSVTFVHEWVARFNYGKTRPWVRRDLDPSGTEVLCAISGPDALTLHSDRLPRARDGRHQDRFQIDGGDRVDFVLTWTPSWEPIPEAPNVEEELRRSLGQWSAWARGNTYQGQYREEVVRSLLVLRLLTQQPTGGIAAAATTSLPELIGGERNWDYRYCWLRDAAMSLEALLELGYREEAKGWRDWLLRAAAGDPDNLQIMYRLDGSLDLPERVLDHLAGYEGSLPVRIGNGAVHQHQNDVLGEVMLAFDLARQSGLAQNPDAWALQRHLVEAMITHWQEPDHGIWEVRGPKRHFTHSKIMCWAVMDCAVRAVEVYGLDGPVSRWQRIREEIRADVLTHGFNTELGSFVQYYGSDQTDAALLQIVQVGFLPTDDPRVLGTIATIRAQLSDGPWVHRYLNPPETDGLKGGESPFLACCFWLVDALARTGDLETAEEYMRQLLAATNDVGLLSEEYDPHARRFTGNMPQAFSHLTLIRAAHSIYAARRLRGAA
jgi:GH15 family glucan-1,4-alpha-glucosidase